MIWLKKKRNEKERYGTILRRKDMGLYWTTRRHKGTQMITMCQKSLQIENICRGNTDTTYKTTNNSPAFFEELK